jgi:hypothetical protein
MATQKAKANVQYEIEKKPPAIKCPVCGSPNGSKLMMYDSMKEYHRKNPRDVSYLCDHNHEFKVKEPRPFVTLKRKDLDYLIKNQRHELCRCESCRSYPDLMVNRIFAEKIAAFMRWEFE